MPQALSVTAAIVLNHPPGPIATATCTKDGTVNNTFTIDCLAVRQTIGGLRGREMHVTVSTGWTVSGACTGMTASMDNSAYWTMTKFDESGNIAVPVLNTAGDYVWIICHDFRYAKVTTTGGSLSSDSFLFSIY